MATQKVTTNKKTAKTTRKTVIGGGSKTGKRCPTCGKPL